MTIAEIAQELLRRLDHGGKTGIDALFRRPHCPHHFLCGKGLKVLDGPFVIIEPTLSAANLAATDWEFVDKPLDKPLDKTPETPGSNEPDILLDKPADILFDLTSGEGLCDKCRVPLKLGVAPRVVQVGHGDFLGEDGPERGCTMNDHWPGGLMQCWKCPQCGKSWTVVNK